MHNYNCITLYRVGSGREFEGSSASTIGRQCQDRRTIGDKFYQGGPYVLQNGLQGIGDGSRDQVQGRDHHYLVICGRVAG